MIHLSQQQEEALSMATFRKITIPKKSGGVRNILIPDENSREVMRCIARQISWHCEAKTMTRNTILFLSNTVFSNAVHGFRRLRSPATNAFQHLGYQWTLCADLKDFFPSVRYAMVKSQLERKELSTINYFMKISVSRQNALFPNGIAEQGIPTSPVFSNIAAIPVDESIEVEWPDVIYTRYADDLSFSSNDRNVLDEIRNNLSAIVQGHGFTINEEKWRLMGAKYVRRVITGISVGETDMKPTRKLRRWLRWRKHNFPKSRKTLGADRWADYVEHYPEIEMIRMLGDEVKYNTLNII